MLKKIKQYLTHEEKFVREVIKFLLNEKDIKILSFKTDPEKKKGRSLLFSIENREGKSLSIFIEKVVFYMPYLLPGRVAVKEEPSNWTILIPCCLEIANWHQENLYYDQPYLITTKNKMVVASSRSTNIINSDSALLQILRDFANNQISQNLHSAQYVLDLFYPNWVLEERA